MTRTPDENAELIALSMCLTRFNDCRCGLKAEVCYRDGAPYCMVCARQRWDRTPPADRGIVGLALSDFDRALRECDANDNTGWTSYDAPVRSEPNRKLAARFNQLLRGEP